MGAAEDTEVVREHAAKLIDLLVLQNEDAAGLVVEWFLQQPKSWFLTATAMWTESLLLQHGVALTEPCLITTYDEDGNLAAADGLSFVQVGLDFITHMQQGRFNEAEALFRDGDPDEVIPAALWIADQCALRIRDLHLSPN